MAMQVLQHKLVDAFLDNATSDSEELRNTSEVASFLHGAGKQIPCRILSLFSNDQYFDRLQ